MRQHTPELITNGASCTVTILEVYLASRLAENIVS